MKKHMTWITAVAAVGLSATIAFAGTNGNWHGQANGHRHHQFARLATKLNLTDAQKAQWKDIRKASHEQNKAFFAEVRQTRQDFRAAKQANDQAKIDALKPTMQAQRQQMKQIRQANMQQFESILTPDQKAQLDALKAKWEARRAQRQ